MSTTQIEEKLVHDILILGMKGRLLSEPESLELRKRFHGFVEQKTTHIVIDLSGVNHINSIGLGALISALTTIRIAGGDIRLASINENVIGLFVITHLNRVFEIFKTP